MTKKPEKSQQKTLAEYLKSKEKTQQKPFQFNIPTVYYYAFGIPLAVLLFLVIYFLAKLRFLPEH